MVETTNKPKKIGGRTIAIVLGMVCLVLAAGLIAAVAVYLPTQSTIARLNSENAGLQGNVTSLSQQIVNLQNILTQRDGSIADKDSQIADLRASYDDEINNLLNILNLNVSATLEGREFSMATGENLTIWAGSVNYAGYFTVLVDSSSNTTFAQVTYSSFGINFDQSIVVGTSGIASFPVLPDDNINIILGNTELVDSVNGAVTVTYIY